MPARHRVAIVDSGWLIIWYRANRISGLALLAAGLFWLALGIVLPLLMPSQNAAQLVTWYGLASLGVAVAVSFWLTYRDP